VTTTAGTSTNDAVFYVPPRLSSFTPSNAVVGASVELRGTNLTDASAVLFGNAPAPFTIASNQITAVVPTNARTGPLTLTAPGGVFITANSFRVLPNITGFTPALGSTGTVVIIQGTSFFDVSRVTFNNIDAIGYTVSSSEQIQAAVPPNATTGPIRVTTPDGVAVSATDFLVTQASDLEVQMSASAMLLRPNQPLTYMVTVSNRGPSIVTGVTVIDALPQGVELLSADSTLGTVTNHSGTIQCTVGVLTNGVGFTLTINTLPSVERYLTNSAAASMIERDINPANNSDSVVTTVVADASRTLRIARLPGGANVTVSWPISPVNFVLQSLEFFSSSNTWIGVTNQPAVVNGRNTVTNDASAGSRFFRLRKP
jgi:uncharacterized repeat protein (TIGR01451 family)